MPHTAPANPSLPQNDTPEQQAARAIQLDLTRLGYQWGTVGSLPEVPVVQGLPANETPTLSWWVMLAGILVKLVENHIAVQLEALARDPLVEAGEIAVNQALVAEIKAEVTVIQGKIAHNTSGGTFWSRLKEDVELGVLSLGEEALAERFENHARKLCAALELGVASEADLGSGFPCSLEAYRDLFQDIPLPGIAWTFQDDAEFARLRVAGPNPMLLARVVDALPAKFPLDQASYAAVVGGDTLEAALDEGRLYLLDYEALSVLIPGSTDGQAKFVYCPLALFAVPPGGVSLVPVAIQCGQDPAEHPIFMPSVRADEQWGWDIAKLIVQVADGNWHELFAHLAHTHLVIEAVAVATRRHLAEVHPLWALLMPHFEGTLFINYEAATSLITAGGPIDRIFGGTIASSQQTAADARISFDFTQRMLPNDLKARGVGDAGMLPDYPYRDDALLIWQAIHEWVQGYVGLYYTGDDAVTADSELQAWAATIAREGQVKGFGPVQTVHQLIDCCTMILFTASAQHAAVNFPQATIMEFAPAVTGAGWQAEPVERHGHDRQEWLSYMPPTDLALKQLEVLYLLGSLHYRPLGTYLSRDFPYPAWFTDPKVTGSEGPLPHFQAALLKVEQRIAARNAARRISYPYLLPSRIPTSINI